MPDGELTKFALAMTEEHKREDPVEAYREFYFREKLHFSTWTSPAKMPKWIKDKLKGNT